LGLYELFRLKRKAAPDYARSWQILGEPYSSASPQQEQRFWWWRARMLGGRTNHWGRISLRNGPYDYQAAHA
jgi:choline dehydrogenase-like flavoprotein